MRVRVLTNMTRLSNVRFKDVEFEFRAHTEHGFSGAFKALIRSFRSDYVLLNSEINDGLRLALLKAVVPFHRAKIILLDVMLSTPTGYRGRAKAWLAGRLLRRVHSIMLYYRNTTGMQQYYGIPAERFQYIPFKINQPEMINGMTPVDGGYVFCGGKTRRDFATLFEAVQGLDFPVKVVTTADSDIARHGSFVDERSAPPNVEVVRLDGSPEPFLSFMASARVVVLPITPEISGAGMSVYIQAMALRKCVILSAGPGAEDVLTSDQAIIVPPSDPAALRQAIERAFTDPSYRALFEHNGYEWAMGLGGEQRLHETVLTHLHADYVASQRKHRTQPVGPTP
jgi:glycosyltransferase involved in cell wall biosynthesis